MDLLDLFHFGGKNTQKYPKKPKKQIKKKRSVRSKKKKKKQAYFSVVDQMQKAVKKRKKW